MSSKFDYYDEDDKEETGLEFTPQQLDFGWDSCSSSTTTTLRRVLPDLPNVFADFCRSLS